MGIRIHAWAARLFLGLSALAFVAPATAAEETSQPGLDIEAAFARAARGAPLRYVAIGGSITEASGPGWIGDWLRETFPESLVTTVNSGMSGTGSSLGIFRLERDILAHQPDLVAIEYCVNDGALTDEEAIRYVETLVVRLKSSPRPPAIVILESAARTGVNLDRHRRVARHYGLLEVDFQAAVDARLRDEKLPWSAFFSDDVHPNKAGHALYAETMRRALEPLARRARAADADTSPRPSALPAPLSAKPLLLDARLVPLQGHGRPSSDWRAESTPGAWWGRFFQGVLAAERPGATLSIPFRGTMAGVFFAMQPEHGSFFINIDGGVPTQVFVNTRGGFSSVLAETDLPAREHVLNIVLPQTTGSEDDLAAKIGGPVKLGYLLIAGETGASSERSPEGVFGVATLRDLRFATVPADAWSWIGPFPAPAAPDGRELVDARSAITSPFAPELEQNPDAVAADFSWRAATGAGGRLDFRALSDSDKPALVYARAKWDAGPGGPAVLSLDADYYARLWLNGERILALEGPHRMPVFLPVTLRPGENRFLLKLGAGSAGFGARLRLAPHGAKN